MAYFPINVNMEGVSILVLTSEQFQIEVIGPVEGLVSMLNGMHHSRFAAFKTPDRGLVYLNTDHIVFVIDGPIGGRA